MSKSKFSKKGSLVLIGGAEDRKNDKTVLRDLIQINNANHVVVIPAATLYPIECGEDYFDAFTDLGIKNIDIFDIRDRNDADDSKYLKKLDAADVVFFTGGDQVRLSQILANTKLIEYVKFRFENENLTIGATSAGASAAADPMTYNGENIGLVKGSIKFDKGFGFIENIIIDTHFVARGRLGLLAQFLCNGYTKKGIGIGEDTSITIKPDDTFYVIGSGIVTVVSADNLHFSNFDQIEKDEKISIDGIQLGFLQQGAIFDLKTWKTINFIRSSVTATQLELPEQ